MDIVELDYLVIGHVTRDVKQDGSFAIGGTAAYAARTALALGCRVGVVTSAGPDLALDGVLDGVRIARFDASATTTFENVYTTRGRHQVLHSVAETLTAAMIPSHWRGGIVHVGPVASESDPSLLQAVDDAFIGVTPQGWMRHWDQDGRVRRRNWERAEEVLAQADAVVLSEEDVAGDEDRVRRYADRARLLVLTRGAAGCSVYSAGEVRHLVAPSVPETDPTGAGDIFAAAFFVALQRGTSPWDAARFANCVAARSVTRSGLSSTPGAEDIDHCNRILGDSAGYAHHLCAG